MAYLLSSCLFSPITIQQVRSNVHQNIKKIFRDFSITLDSPLVYYDNQAAIHIASNLTFQHRFHEQSTTNWLPFFSKKVQQGLLRLFSHNQLADVMSKALPNPQFRNILSKVGIQNIFIPSCERVLDDYLC